MSGAEKIDRDERRKRAETRLAHSRPARDAAAAAHAGRMVMRAGPTVQNIDDTSSILGHPRPALSSLEAKVLDAANDILATKGGEGQTIAELIQRFIAALGPP